MQDLARVVEVTYEEVSHGTNAKSLHQELSFDHCSQLWQSQVGTVGQGFLHEGFLLFVESEQAFLGPKLEVGKACWLFLLELVFLGQLFQCEVLLDQLGLQHSEFRGLDLELPPDILFPQKFLFEAKE